MSKKWLFVATAILIVVIFIVFIALNLKKAKTPLSLDVNKHTSISGLLAHAKNLESAGNFSSAKEAYERLVNEFPNSGEIINWQKKIDNMNIKLLFSPAIAAHSILYEIKPQDTLTKIAKEFKTTVDLIKKSNNLVDDVIFPGRKIKVWNAPFNIVVDKSQNTLILKTGEEIIKTYIVSTGVNNSTPVGTFKIVNKLINPTWFKPGEVIPASSPQNILGTRWLGFNLPAYGIHGTSEPQSLGKQVTQGCVRMANSDVEELYTIIPVGTEVTIID